MKYFLLIFLLIPSFIFAQENNEENQERKLSAFTVVSLQDANLDWWTKVPPNTVFLQTPKKVYKGEKFICISFTNSVTKSPNEAYKIKYTFSLTKENEEPKILREEVLEGVQKIVEHMILLSLIGIVFEESDDFGNYVFTLNVENLLNGETATSTYKLELAPWVSPATVDTVEKVNEVIQGFNHELNPDLLYSIFLSDKFTFYQRGHWHGINPVGYSFFVNAFNKFDFLYEHLMKEENFENQNSTNRQKIIMLNSFAKRDAIDENILTRDEIAFQNYVRNEFNLDDNPYENIEALQSLDLLWGEFFATGKYAPVRRILDALAFYEESLYAKDVLAKDTNAESPEDKEKLIKGLIYFAAEKSIGSNVKNKLLLKYLQWADYNDLPIDLQFRLRSIFDKKVESFKKAGFPVK